MKGLLFSNVVVWINVYQIYRQIVYFEHGDIIWQILYDQKSYEYYTFPDIGRIHQMIYNMCSDWLAETDVSWLNKYLSLKDTLLVENQKHYRLELAIDSTPQEYQSQKIQTAYENLEAMANEGFRIALKAPTPDKSIVIITIFILFKNICSFTL